MFQDSQNDFSVASILFIGIITVISLRKLKAFIKRNWVRQFLLNLCMDEFALVLEYYNNVKFCVRIYLKQLFFKLSSKFYRFKLSVLTCIENDLFSDEVRILCAFRDVTQFRIRKMAFLLRKLYHRLPIYFCNAIQWRIYSIYFVMKNILFGRKPFSSIGTFLFPEVIPLIQFSLVHTRPRSLSSEISSSKATSEKLLNPFSDNYYICSFKSFQINISHIWIVFLYLFKYQTHNCPCGDSDIEQWRHCLLWKVFVLMCFMEGKKCINSIRNYFLYKSNMILSWLSRFTNLQSLYNVIADEVVEWLTDEVVEAWFEGFDGWLDEELVQLLLDQEDLVHWWIDIT